MLPEHPVAELDERIFAACRDKSVINVRAENYLLHSFFLDPH